MVGQENEVKFPCWSCQKDLDAYIKANGLQLGDQCIYCKEEIHMPLKPPE